MNCRHLIVSKTAFLTILARYPCLGCIEYQTVHSSLRFGQVPRNSVFWTQSILELSVLQPVQVQVQVQVHPAKTARTSPSAQALL